MERLTFEAQGLGTAVTAEKPRPREIARGKPKGRAERLSLRGWIVEVFFCAAVKASAGTVNTRVVAEVVLTAGVKGTAGAIVHREGSGDGGTKRV